MRPASLIVTLAFIAACSTTQSQRRNEDASTRPARETKTVRVAPDPAKMEEAAAAGSKAVGRMAPDFSLLNMKETSTKLSDFRGKWTVLYFYPKDDTPGCVCEATEFTDLLYRFHRLKSAIVGISPDSPAEHRKFTKKYGLQVNLLSDPDKVAMREYGAWVDTNVAGTTQGRVVRSTFLIDPQGKIAYHWPEVIPEGHAERVRQRLVKVQLERNKKVLGDKSADA